MHSHGKPLEECPKPKTYAELECPKPKTHAQLLQLVKKVTKNG